MIQGGSKFGAPAIGEFQGFSRYASTKPFATQLQISEDDQPPPETPAPHSPTPEDGLKYQSDKLRSMKCLGLVMLLRPDSKTIQASPVRIFHDISICLCLFPKNMAIIGIDPNEIGIYPEIEGFRVLRRSGPPKVEA